ncbi:speedy protein E4-like [Pseudophryne corroboree]|uniref:speedy protein E4-like n=1 Tax=Pseudophryne corroboree TaxID=495146 RepID=UPI0030818999
MSDKYLLAMIYIYFERANLAPSEYDCVNFFCALFLANQMEEENFFYYKMYADIAVLINLKDFEKRKNIFWARMQWRTFVTPEELEEVMRDEHYIWRRERRAHLATPTYPVIRRYKRKYHSSSQY